MAQSAETRSFLYAHTGKLLPSIKQIVPICFAFSFLIFPNFASAENIPTANPGCTTTVLGAQNIANGSAALEPDFSANTINTTWYSNGTAMTVDSAYQTCTYDAPLTPPTPADRPGYAFAGWKLRAQCLIPSTDINNNAESESIGCLDINGDIYCAGETGFDQNAPNYGISNPGEWGVTWSNGDKVTGVALCSALPGNNHNWAWGGNSADWTSDETTLTSATGETKYCWCKATHYTANNAQQCSLSSPAWVFYDDGGSAADCAYVCALGCAAGVQDNSVFRVAVFIGLVAQ